MPGWQESREGRIGNTAERFDAPVGHVFPQPEGTRSFCPLAASLVAHGLQAHIAPRFWPVAKMPCVAAKR